MGLTRAAPILPLVKAFSKTYDDARDPSLWPTPEDQGKRHRPRSYAATTATSERTTTVRVVALAVTQTKMGVVDSTTAVGVTEVADVEEARRGLVVAPDVIRYLALKKTTVEMAAAALEDGEIAREAARTGKTRRLLLDRLHAHARTTTA